MKSTDDFWIINGEYQYNKYLAAHAHSWNQQRAKKAMEQGISPIVIDNTNVATYEARPYVLEADKHNYNISIQESNAPWKCD